MSLTTLPNAKPSLGEASIVGHGPMSVIIGYRITDDGGETITETGCLYALASAAADQQRVVLKDYRKDQERQTLLLPDLRRNTTYMIWPYATSRMGETVGEAITFTTGVFMNSKVRDVTMPEALRLVPTATFQGCAQLQVVRLGSKTELISDYAFTDCPLTDLYVEARMPPVCQPTAFATLGADVLASCRVHVPKGRANIYKASEGWNLFKNIITD